MEFNLALKQFVNLQKMRCQQFWLDWLIAEVTASKIWRFAAFLYFRFVNLLYLCFGHWSSRSLNYPTPSTKINFKIAIPSSPWRSLCYSVNREPHRWPDRDESGVWRRLWGCRSARCAARRGSWGQTAWWREAQKTAQEGAAPAIWRDGRRGRKIKWNNRENHHHAKIMQLC